MTSHAQRQRTEIEEEDRLARLASSLGEEGREGHAMLGKALQKSGGSGRRARFADARGDEDDWGAAGDNEDDDDEDGAFDEAALWSEYDREVGGISADEERALAAFMSEDRSSRTLSDIILSKIRENQVQEGLDVIPEDGEAFVPSGLSPKVVEVYRSVGELLSR